MTTRCDKCVHVNFCYEIPGCEDCPCLDGTGTTCFQKHGCENYGECVGELADMERDAPTLFDVEDYGT